MHRKPIWVSPYSRGKAVLCAGALYPRPRPGNHRRRGRRHGGMAGCPGTAAGNGPLLELLRGLLPLLQKVLQLLLLALELVLQLLELSLELCVRHVLPRVLRVVLEPAARGRR